MVIAVVAGTRGHPQGGALGKAFAHEASAGALLPLIQGQTAGDRIDIATQVMRAQKRVPALDLLVEDRAGRPPGRARTEQRELEDAHGTLSGMLAPCRAGCGLRSVVTGEARNAAG